MKTDKEHVATGGGQCPKCGSDNIVGEQLTVDSGSCFQPVSCLDCHFSWKDTYQLVGYEPEE